MGGQEKGRTSVSIFLNTSVCPLPEKLFPIKAKSLTLSLFLPWTTETHKATSPTGRVKFILSNILFSAL